MPSLRTSAYKLLLDLLKLYKLEHKHNKTDFVISHGNNEIWFRPLDDVEKIKSIEGINYIWVEEATEITEKDYLQLDLRCRGHNENGPNGLFFTFNPTDPRSFLKGMSDNPPDDCSVNHSTYRDNPFLDAVYIRQLQSLIRKDITYHKIYNKGEWATPGNLIYDNHDIISTWPEEDFFDSIGYGIDFGFNLPATILEVGIHDGDVWERERLYQTGLTNTGLIEQLKKVIPPHARDRVIRADPAEPARIEEIFEAGFNVHPCIKGHGSVKLGIDRVKRLTIHILNTSTNLIDEKETYKWKEDKFGNTLDEPVDYRDHLMDAERYYLGEAQLILVDVIEAGPYGWK